MGLRDRRSGERNPGEQVSSVEQAGAAVQREISFEGGIAPEFIKSARLSGKWGWLGDPRPRIQRMMDQIDYHEVESVTCSIDGVEQVCSLDQTSTPDSHWTLVLTAPDGTTWTGAGQGLWTAFVELRRQLEPLGHRMCCAGARIDAYMRRGRSYDGYLVDLWTRRTFFGIRHQAALFDYAPANLLTTVDEQLARYQRWIETPWWRALLPGDPVR